MLEFRRVIAFASRVHSFLLILYLFFGALFLLASAIVMPDDLLALVLRLQALLSWTIIFFGLWIMLACLVSSLYSHVLALAPFLTALLRIAILFVLAFFLDLLNSLFLKGFSF